MMKFRHPAPAGTQRDREARVHDRLDRKTRDAQRCLDELLEKGAVMPASTRWFCRVTVLKVRASRCRPSR
jgi:hypothetical protein